MNRTYWVWPRDLHDKPYLGMIPIWAPDQGNSEKEPMKTFKDGDTINIEGTAYVIAKTVAGVFVLIEAKHFTPLEADL